jgi:hypothetical protein
VTENEPNEDDVRDAAVALVKAMDRSLGPGWRKHKLAPEYGAEVNAAWLRLLQAIDGEHELPSR